MIVVGGVVFRVVTPNHPGCPKLDRQGAPYIRTEYLANDKQPWEWTMVRSAAHIFPTHLEAEKVAWKIGSRCHVRVLEEGEVGEASLSQQSVSGLIELPKLDRFREAQIRRDPVESAA